MTENVETADDAQIARKGAARFLRFSLIYSLGDLLAKGARIVLIPFYLSVMTPPEIGELAILQAIIFCSWTILGFGFNFAVHRYFHEYKQDGNALVSSLWLVRLIGGLPFFGLLLLAGYGFHLYSSATISLDLVLLAITAGYLRGGINIVEYWLNIREEPVKYRAFTLLQFVLTTSLIIFLVGFQKLGVKGAILGELISYGIFVFLSAFMLFRQALPNLRVVRWRAIFAYCTPVLPHAFFMWGLTGADRLILNEYVDRSEIGIYSIGCLLGSFLTIIANSMRAAWLPSYFKSATEADSNRQFGRIASIYLFMTLFAALCGMCFAPEIVYLFSLTSSASYAESALVMQLILFGSVSLALFIALNQPLFYERRTGLVSAISGFGLFVNIIANLLLIPAYGIWGAAIANFIAYFAMTFATGWITQHIYRITWETAALLLTTSLFLVCGGIACLFPVDVKLWHFPLKILLVLLFPLLTLFRIKFSAGSMIQLESRFSWTRVSAMKKYTA